MPLHDHDEYTIAKTRIDPEKVLKVFELAPAAFAVLSGNDHVFCLANGAYQKLFGQQIVGKCARDVWPETDGKGILAILQQVYNTGIPFSADEFPARLLHPGNTKERYFNFAVHPVFDEHNDVTDLMVHAYEVTDQVISRRKIAESESYFRKIADSVPATLWIADKEGSCRYLSQVWYDVTGQLPEEALGFGWLQAVHPEDRDDTERIFMKATREGFPFDILYRLKCINTGYRWVIDSGRPRFDPSGVFEGFVGSIVDMHNQKLAEEKVRESELRYRNIFEHTPISIWEQDFSHVKNEIDELKRRGIFNIRQYFKQHPGQLNNLIQRVTISDVNVATLKFLEAASKEEVKKGLHQVFVYDTSNAFIRELEIIASGGGRFEFETTLQTLRGKRREVLVHIDFPKSDDYSSVLVTVVDISVIRRAEGILKESKVRLEELVKERTAELKRSNEDLQQFAHVASHDLKEPIRKIQTFVSKIRLEWGDDFRDKLASYLDKIDKSACRMNSMVEGVLNYSSLQTMPNLIEQVDLNNVFEEIQSDLEVMISERSAIIRCDSPLPRVRGTAVLIYQLFYNLVYNALKFTRLNEVPRVEISGEVIEKRDRTFARIDVWDNGIGFEPVYKERIFETFTRLNSKDRFEGTGLGLSLCKKIVQRHGGEIWAEGKLNEGAVFTVLLPV